jgi:hypothetical protein
MAELMRFVNGNGRDGFDFKKLILTRKDYLRVVTQVFACGARLTGTAEEQSTAPALTQEISRDTADEDEPLEDLSERWRLHRVADPETPRKPCGSERGSSADAGGGSKAV